MKTEANAWENSRADQWKPETHFTCSIILTNFAEVFNRLLRHGQHVYFFYKIIIFIANKKKDDIQSAYCKFSQLGDSQTTLLTSFSCFIALWKHTCRPIKTHVLSKLFYNRRYGNFNIINCAFLKLNYYRGINNDVMSRRVAQLVIALPSVLEVPSSILNDSNVWLPTFLWSV